MRKGFISNIKLVTIIFSIGFIGCRELLTDEFPVYDAVPVVNCILVQGNFLFVNLSFSGGIDSLLLPFVDNAKIMFYCDGEQREQLKYEGEGNYSSTAIVKPGCVYLCKVIIPGYDTIVCSQILPEATQVIGVETIGLAGYDEDGFGYHAITFSFPNNVFETKYYEVSIKSLSFSEEGTMFHINQMATSADPVILNEGISIPLFSNETITDSVYTMTLNYYPQSTTEWIEGVPQTTFLPVVVELRSVTHDYYLYQKQYCLYNNGLLSDGLWSNGVSISLYSNIENGYGIFAGYSVAVSDTITPK